MGGSGHDPQAVHQQLADVLDTVVAEIKQIWTDARSNGIVKQPAWPMIVLRTPKGWTCPPEIDGKKTEDYWRSHQVPMGEMHGNPGQLCLTGKQTVELDEVAGWMSGKCEGKKLYFGACSILRAPNGDLQEFLPAWGRGVTVFFNTSYKSAPKGARAADVEAASKRRINWGATFHRGRFGTSLKWNHVPPPKPISWVGVVDRPNSRTYLDLDVSFRFSPRFALFASAKMRGAKR